MPPVKRRKAFSVEEANATLALLETILDELQAKKVSIQQLAEKIEILDVMWGEAAAQSDNPDSVEYGQLRQSLQRAVRDLEEFVEREILGRGLRFPVGGLEHGLIDFPTTFEGRWVFMCWKRGEDEISYWHEIDAGFRGRQEISAEHIIAMGKLDDPDLIDDSRLDL